jgi:ABC-type spermidine/putrescine transport system permease subunit II
MTFPPRLRPGNVLLALATCAVIAFLFAPIVTTVIFAFNQGSSGRQTTSFTGFTTHWFGAAWANLPARQALTTSLIVAACSAVFAGLLGTATGYALARPKGRFLASRTLEALVYLLLIVPEIVLAVSLLLLYSKMGVTLGLVPLTAAHTLFPTAIVAVIVRSRVVALDRSLEDAAADLGAGGARTFADIQLPLLMPAILAGMMLSFTFSFDDLVISVFLTTPTVNTLPVYLFSTVHSGVRPDVYAIATMMLAFTLSILAVAALLYRSLTRRTGSRQSALSALASVSETEALPGAA